ncbi:hypothetical protein [Streptomyces sp. NPDC014733]|uniref:hypothetical protein n=1 Tax=Streptomyces sp. NPDC014733 TaxID=3364885 RepID=UPI0036F60194
MTGKHFSLPALIAMLTAGGALLTGCGITPQYPIEKASPAHHQPAPTPSHSSARPPLESIPGLKAKFESWSADDVQEKSVLLDGKMAILTGYSAVAKSDPDAPEIGHYYSGKAAQDARTVVRQAKERHRAPVGTIRYSDPYVESLGENSAFLSYCIGDRGLAAKDPRTGEHFDGAPAGPERMTVVMYRESGVWKTDSMTPSGEC